MPDLGSLKVSRQGLGGMSLSSIYGHSDDAESIATVHRAIDLGITFFDTATGYGAGHNEELLGRAIRENRSSLVIASKFTHSRNGGGRIDAREAVEASLKRLGLEQIDLYYLHRIDPEVPVEDSIGQLGRLADEGKIGAVGISEADASELRRAHATYPLTALQSEYSLWTREIEDEILPAARELGIGFVGYSPLGRGFLAGVSAPEEGDRRAIHPRFQQDAIEANARRRRAIEDIARRLDATPAQVSLAWVLSKGVVPIPGTRRIAHLESNWAANDLVLDAGSIAELEAAFPRGATIGDRYPAEQMKQVPEAKAYA